MNMTYRIIIFDVNGVLIDSNAANARAMAQAFTNDPGLRDRLADLYLQLTGIDRGSKIRLLRERIIGKPFEAGEFETIWERFKQLGRRSMMEAPLGRGSKEVLTELGRRGVTRVALSNTPPVELQEILVAHGLRRLLNVVRGGGDWPKSESLRRLLDEFRFDPGRCLFIGDGKGDLAAARHAGVPFAAIDAVRGEFEGETGFDGPYRDVADWAAKALGVELS